MPRCDGLEATRRIRAGEAACSGGPHVYIIALTAHASAEDRQECLDTGMVRNGPLDPFCVRQPFPGVVSRETVISSRWNISRAEELIRCPLVPCAGRFPRQACQSRRAQTHHATPSPATGLALIMSPCGRYGGNLFLLCAFPLSSQAIRGAFERFVKRKRAERARATMAGVVLSTTRVQMDGADPERRCSSTDKLSVQSSAASSEPSEAVAPAAAAAAAGGAVGRVVADGTPAPPSPAATGLRSGGRRLSAEVHPPRRAASTASRSSAAQQVEQSFEYSPF